MFIRKKFMSVLGAALAAGALAAVALGQEGVPARITATVKVTPRQAGTPSHPRGVKIVARGTIDTPDGAARQVPGSADVWFPKGWMYNGAKHPACALATLNSGGPGKCPPGSIMGHSALTIDDPDNLNPPPRVTVINGGPAKMYFWVVIQNPARVQAAVTGTITKPSSPRWSSQLHADIPSSLQVVSGIPVTPDSFSVSFGHGDWIATTSCPRDHLWRYHLRMTSTSGQVLDTGGSATCRS
jgi:hypothetical protein